MKIPRIEGMKYNEPPYDSLKSVKFKLFIDHIDNEDKRIWAVMTNKKYLTAQRVIIKVKLMKGTQSSMQPHAFIEGTGRIIQAKKKTIYIY